jgi:asparagine synthase (glutamine-hydrolysing)
MVRRWNINARLSFRSRIETVDPFFDYDLVDFACNIPSELRLRRSLVRKELKRHHPEQKHIPIEGGLMTDILRMLGQQIHITRIFPWLKHERNVMSAYLRAEKEFIEKILFDDRTLKRGIFDPEAIKRVVGDHMSNKKDYCNTIGMLVSIELWFRLFLDT